MLIEDERKSGGGGDVLEQDWGAGLRRWCLRSVLPSGEDAHRRDRDRQRAQAEMPGPVRTAARIVHVVDVH